MRKYKPIYFSHMDACFTPQYIKFGNGDKIYNKGLVKRYNKYKLTSEFLIFHFWKWLRDRTYPWRVLGWETTRTWDRGEVWEFRKRESLKYIEDWKPYYKITSSVPFTKLVPHWLQKKTKEALSIMEETEEFINRISKIYKKEAEDVDSYGLFKIG